MKLSILIASITERVGDYFPDLVKRLRAQIGDRKDVEIVAFLDNRMRTVGVKRQDLLGLAQGEYIVYFDDDDTPSDDYVASIMAVLDQGDPQLDAISFHVRYTNVGTGETFIGQYDKDRRHRGKDADGTWRGPLTHIQVIRKDIAASVTWPERPRGRQWKLDVVWSDAVSAKVKKQATIDKVLYFYNFDRKMSETLKRNRNIGGR